MHEIRRLGANDAGSLIDVLRLFATVFEDADSYLGAPPGGAYAASLLDDDGFILLTAHCEGEMVGALAAYRLRKFERERSEIYIYDLAVAERFRRRGVATALIGALRPIARAMGAWVIYVQADVGDEPAIALYRKLGVQEDVHHFDIDPAAGA
jgi:aminoglycoside 3-N-acetyltransferase I